MKEGLNKGITLVALIITVIILLILAGTAISIAINGGDIFSKSTTAKEEWNEKVAEENQIGLNVIAMINDYERSTTYGLVGDRFIVKSIPEIDYIDVTPKGTTFEDGRKGFTAGHYEKQTGGWDYVDINKICRHTDDDVYLCYDGSSWNIGCFYVYTPSGEFLGTPTR